MTKDQYKVTVETPSHCLWFMDVEAHSPEDAVGEAQNLLDKEAGNEDIAREASLNIIDDRGEPAYDWD